MNNNLVNDTMGGIDKIFSIMVSFNSVVCHFFSESISIFVLLFQNQTNMAANLFGRYVWLVDVIRRYTSLTYEEINELWQKAD